jgi:hypothetical protein
MSPVTACDAARRYRERYDRHSAAGRRKRHADRRPSRTEHPARRRQLSTLDHRFEQADPHQLTKPRGAIPPAIKLAVLHNYNGCFRRRSWNHEDRKAPRSSAWGDSNDTFGAVPTSPISSSLVTV